MLPFYADDMRASFSRFHLHNSYFLTSSPQSLHVLVKYELKKKEAYDRHSEGIPFRDCDVCFYSNGTYSCVTTSILIIDNWYASCMPWQSYDTTYSFTTTTTLQMMLILSSRTRAINFLAKVPSFVPSWNSQLMKFFFIHNIREEKCCWVDKMT